MSDDIKITPIKSVIDKSEFTDGDTVKKVRGKITALYEVRRGDDYEYQNGDFVGEDGGKVRICFSKCSQSSSVKNKTITITAHKGKDGWTGIKVIDKEYEKDGEKKSQRELRITPTANIEIEGGGSSGGESSGGGQSKSSGGGGQSQPRNEAHPSLVIEDTIMLHFDVKRKLKELYGESFREEDVATVFIALDKQGQTINYKERAAKPIPVKYPPAPKDPNDWKECVMPWGKEGVIGRKLSAIEPDKIKAIHAYFEEKGLNTDLAECVYQAARDLKLFEEENKAKEQQAADDAALDAAPDDIPF